MSTLVQQIQVKMALVAKEIHCDVLDLTLSAGAGLALYGVRTHFDDLDLDIALPKFKLLKSEGKYPHKTLQNGVELLSVFPWADVHGQVVKVDTVVMHGIRVFTVEALINQKITLLKLPGRPVHKLQQDAADIKALEKLLLKKERG